MIATRAFRTITRENQTDAITIDDANHSDFFEVRKTKAIGLSCDQRSRDWETKP
jgi:hypothetical protein